MHPIGVTEHENHPGRIRKSASRRIVLTAVGSLGDLHPYLALARELARRGHHPVVATLPSFRERVEAAGLPFHPIRAAIMPEPGPELMRRVFHGRKGIEYIVRELMLPALRTAYDDTCAAARNADLLVTHPLTYATQLVAETRNLPWVSTQLAPISLFSATDPPLLPGLSMLRSLPVGAAGYRAIYALADRQTRSWMRPYDVLRAQLGLPDRGNVLFAGGRSPLRELALFSPLFAEPQTDWPAQTVATGFPFFDQALPPDPALEAFLDAGSPPIIFTLGSSAVMDPGNFFRVSAEAAQALGRRALLLGANLGTGVGAPPTATPALSKDLLAYGYGSYARLFPRASAIVHQGGVGTTAEALRSGRPMLVVPYGADQPDNAARIVRLGVGRTMARGQYRKARVTLALRRLLERPQYAARAETLGDAIRAERGAEVACDAIEAVLHRPD